MIAEPDVALTDYALVVETFLRRSYNSESQPGRAGSNQITIDLWPTSYVFGKGHKLRLEVSSSNYPHFDRTPIREARLRLSPSHKG